MITRNPKSRFDLNIKKSEKVLEVGGGHNPHPRSNVVIDKFIESNYHRSGDIKVLKNQKFMQGDGENLPFADKEFDYVICCHVLEHVENPTKFLSEQFRVAKRGYIEFPSIIGEYLVPKESHRWVMHEMNGTLYIVEKEKAQFQSPYDLGELIQEYLPKNSIGFKVVERTSPNLLTVRIEWDSSFDHVVEPTDPQIRQYFKGPWKLEWADAFFPEKSKWQELKDTSSAMGDILKSVFRSKVLKKS